MDDRVRFDFYRRRRGRDERFELLFSEWIPEGSEGLGAAREMVFELERQFPDHEFRMVAKRTSLLVRD